MGLSYERKESRCKNAAGNIYMLISADVLMDAFMIP
jgi:hypothetical protein